MPNRKPDKTVKKLERTELTYGIYRVIAGRDGASARAEAYLGSRRVHTATEASVETAIAAATAALDLRTTQLRSLREGGVPSAAEFLEALQALQPRTFSALAPLLRAHRHLPGHTATLSDIARVTSLTEEAAIALYLKLGKALASALDLSAGSAAGSRRLAPLLTFAAVESAGDQNLKLQLRPSFVAALVVFSVPRLRSAA